MAQFGKRFRKARKRRQERRSDFLQTFQEQRTERVKARQTGKTDRSGFRNMRRADVVQSKAQGGYFLPQSVQARQSTITSGIGLVGNLANPLGSIGAGVMGMANGGQSSPYGGGFSSSGMESVYYEEDPSLTDRLTPGNIEEWIQENMVIVVGSAGLLLYLLTRKK